MKMPICSRQPSFSFFFFHLFTVVLMVPGEKFSVRMPMYSSMARGLGCNRGAAGSSPIIGMSRNVLHVKSK